jgi:PAS domain S-box-containing protein
MGDKRFSQLMQKVTDFAILFKNVDGIIEEWNVGAERLFGYPRDEAVGKSIEIIYTPDDRTKGEAPNEMKRAATNGVTEDERWHIRKDGSAFYASGLLHALYDGDQLTGFVKIVRDLTQRIELESAIDDESTTLDINIVERASVLGEMNKVLRMELARQKREDYLRLRLLQKVVQTQEDERKRISRDIHDHLGQELTALRLAIQTTKSLGRGLSQEMQEQIGRLEAMGEQIDATVDFLAWELRPNAVTEVGLQQSLVNFVNEWSKQFKVPAETRTVHLDDKRLTPITEINLYRIMQESLNNIAKHAKASKVNVLLESRNEEVALIIEDDGVGFDPEMNSNKVDGLGLIGMGERAALLNGELEVESRPGGGTSIFVKVPAVYNQAQA